MALRKKLIKLVYYEDGADATVSVEDGGASGDNRGIRVNGKPDASTRGDIGTQLLVSHLPMIAKPGAKDVFIFGLGSGISAGALLSYPVNQLTVAENCEAVVKASRFFTNWNRNVLSDSRVHLWREDARTVLKLDPQLYDVIVAQPSNPWTAGIGSVFSREFYQISANRLKAGGIMAQWFHIYEMHDGIVELVLRTFTSVYPYVEIWDAGNGDIIMLGALQPWPSNAASYTQGFAIPDVKADLAKIGITSPELLWARQMASQRTAFAIAGDDGPIQSDLFPVLEYAAPKAFYVGVTSKMLQNYDERTRQMAMAAPDKTAALKALPPAETLPLFVGFSTVNNELLDSLTGRGEGANVPCVFEKKTAPAAEPPKVSSATQQRASDVLNGVNVNVTRSTPLATLEQNQTNSSTAYLMRVTKRQQLLTGYNANK
jgi:hypothetical protein